MTVSYKKLFHILTDRDISNHQFQKMDGYSANITTRLKNNIYVSLEFVEKICRVLNCKVFPLCEKLK